MKILIERYPVEAYVGYYDKERVETQNLFFTLDLELVRPVSRDYGEELERTVDYGEVTACLDKEFGSKHWKLLESVCDRAGNLVLEMFPKVKSATIRVEKSRLPAQIMKTAHVVIEETYHRT